LLELAREDFEVVLVTNEGVCLDFCQKYIPAVLILSVLEGEKIGEIINAVRRLEKKSKNIPRISIMVLHPFSDGGIKILGMGADDCLPRQPNIKELLARLRALIRRYHNNQEQ